MTAHRDAPRGTQPTLTGRMSAGPLSGKDRRHSRHCLKRQHPGGPETPKSPADDEESRLCEPGHSVSTTPGTAALLKPAAGLSRVDLLRRGSKSLPFRDSSGAVEGTATAAAHVRLVAPGVRGTRPDGWPVEEIAVPAACVVTRGGARCPSWSKGPSGSAASEQSTLGSSSPSREKGGASPPAQSRAGARSKGRDRAGFRSRGRPRRCAVGRRSLDGSERNSAECVHGIMTYSSS
jgi:hypothetical protein